MTEEPGPDTGKMADMTRDLAERTEPDPDGTGTLAAQGPGGGAAGLSQNDGVSSGQPLDAQMAQQAHQPAQGTDGGHASNEPSDDDSDT